MYGQQLSKNGLINSYTEVGMDITCSLNGSVLLITLNGCLDATTAPVLEKSFNDKAVNADSIILDMEKLEYISSAGLRVLLFAQKMMDAKGGSMTLRHVCDNVNEIFSMTGFDEVLTIEA